MRARGVPQLPLPQMLLRYTQDTQAPAGKASLHHRGGTSHFWGHLEQAGSLFTDRKPLHEGSTSPRAHLGGEVVLLELPPFPQVPGAHGVVQPPRPQLRTVMRDVYAAGTVRVALELPARKHKKNK